MSDTNGKLFPHDSEVVPARNTGVLPSQVLQGLVHSRVISALPDIEPDQIQPASLDLRLGRKAYRVRASFLPGPKTSVMDRIAQLDGLPEIDISDGAVLEKKAVYVVELLETLHLDAETHGGANPKSSTGRLDILTRLITDNATAFDTVEPGYKGKLYLEVAPLSFPIVVRQGVRLSQLRLHRGVGALPQTTVGALYKQGQLIGGAGPLLPLRDGSLVPVTVDLLGTGPGSIVAYRAKSASNKIDVGLVDHYDPRQFWLPLEATDGRLSLDEDAFYILASREDVGVPRQTAAEMVPYDSRAGEFRVHYAGFFDPGFGWVDGKAQGSKAVLEVRSYGVPFTLEHGQTVGWLRYAQVANGYATTLYGTGVRSNYQGQGLRLAKHFKRWEALPGAAIPPDARPLTPDFF